MSYSERVRQYRFVIRELVSREIKRKYARSSLGIIWSVLNPLLNMALMSMIFSTIFKRNIENFPIYYLTGSLIWGLFSNSTNHALTSLVDNKKLLIKVKLPMSIFPLSKVCSALVNLGYSLLPYAVMLFVFGVKPNRYWLLFFLIVACAFLFSLGLGYFLSVLYVIFGDIKHLYSVMLTMWMYLSAIFYPLERTSAQIQAIIIRNPMYNYIACARQCIMQGVPPTADQWARLFIWTVGVYILGRVFFEKMSNRVLQKV